jgi:hypothetical protein
MNNKPLLYQAKVTDNEDPLMLGRIRAEILTDDNDAALKAQNFKEKDKWGDNDPYIFKPLLPYFIYQVPLVNELILIMYYNSEVKYQNQYYIQSTVSSPLNTDFDDYVSGQRTTGIGTEFKSPLPLKNRIGPLSGTPYDGVFPEPGDNAFLGRGRADIIVKENEILLRTSKTTQKLQPGVFPTGNVGRSFIQLSEFDRIKELKGIKKFTNFKLNTLLVNYLIEWVIFNPYTQTTQNNVLTPGPFTGQVFLFKLKPDIRVNTDELKIDSKIDDLKSLVAVQDFMGLSLDEVSSFINKFISDCNNGLKINGKQVFSLTESQFPIFYRPNNQMYKIINSIPVSPSTNDIRQCENMNNLYPKINLYTNTKTKGYGLIWKLNTLGPVSDVITNTEQTYEFNGKPITFGSMGSDYLVFLSHLSEIPNKGYINLQNTLYGINNDKFSDEIIPKTSSMVRGEELLELLNKIVYFLISHVHQFPLLPPEEETFTDSNIPDLLSELNNASSKILNKYIRLN